MHPRSVRFYTICPLSSQKRRLPRGRQHTHVPLHSGVHLNDSQARGSESNDAGKPTIGNQDRLGIVASGPSPSQVGRTSSSYSSIVDQH